MNLVDEVRRHLYWQAADGTSTISAAVQKRAATAVGSPPTSEALTAAAQKRAATTLGSPPTSEALTAVRHELGACHRCKLSSTRTNIVFGAGAPRAHLMFIGEAPGEEEDAQGLPFVGAAGKLLTKIIEAMKLTRDEVYIANVVKCRPPKNRPPEDDEVSSCLPFLAKQIAAVQPRVLVSLGRTATEAVLGKGDSISALRGHWRSYQGVPLMPTFHPAYLLRNPSAKPLVWKDLQSVMERLGSAA